MVTTRARRSVGVLAAAVAATLAAGAAPAAHAAGRTAGLQGRGPCDPYSGISAAPGLAHTNFYRNMRVNAATPSRTCAMEVHVAAYPGTFDGDVMITAEARGTARLPAGATARVRITSGMRGAATATRVAHIRAGATRWQVQSSTRHRLPTTGVQTYLVRVALTVTGGGSLDVAELGLSGTDR
ncbi:MAG TPA: hypothetical protein VFY17_04260 [Pilimelia sp.]|nr:hypothetical protein [Pilimelia sp.]